MSSKWGRSKSRLRLDGVTWPGGANSPPKGRGHRIKLKAVMLQEQPLLTYGNLQVRLNLHILFSIIKNYSRLFVVVPFAL